MGKLGQEPKSSDCHPEALYIFLFFFLSSDYFLHMQKERQGANGCLSSTLCCDLCLLFLHGLRGRELIAVEHQLYTVRILLTLYSHYAPTIKKLFTEHLLCTRHCSRGFMCICPRCPAKDVHMTHLSKELSFPEIHKVMHGCVVEVLPPSAYSWSYYHSLLKWHS